MFFDTSKYVDFLCKHQITPSQFLLLMLVNDKANHDIIKYDHQMGGWTAAEIEDLIKREYLLDLNVGNQMYADSTVVTDKFTSALLIDAEDAGQELWDAYPWFLNIRGEKYAAKSTNQDKLFKLYHRKIHGNVITHKRVMKLLQIAQEKGLLNMGIEKWVGSTQWNAIAELENETDYETQEIFDIDET